VVNERLPLDFSFMVGIIRYWFWIGCFGGGLLGLLGMVDELRRLFGLLRKKNDK